MTLKSRVQKLEKAAGMNGADTIPEWALSFCRVANEHFGSAVPALLKSESQVEEQARALGREYPSEKAFHDASNKCAPEAQAKLNEMIARINAERS